MLQCLNGAVKELGWLFPLGHPQGICNVSCRISGWLPYLSILTGLLPSRKNFFSPCMSLFLREVSFLKPPANFPLHLT